MTISSEPQTYQAASEDELVRLRIELSISDTALELTYQVIPRQSSELVLLDVLWRPQSDSLGTPEPALAFAQIVKPATLVLYRRTPKLPQLKDVERAYVPWCQLVRPGEALTGHIKLPLPVAETSPYYPHHERAVYRTEVAQQIELQLGYVKKDQVQLAPSGSGPGIMQCTSIQSPPSEIRAVIKLDRPLPVKRRSDRFEPA